MSPLASSQSDTGRQTRGSLRGCVFVSLQHQHTQATISLIERKNRKTPHQGEGGRGKNATRARKEPRGHLKPVKNKCKRQTFDMLPCYQPSSYQHAGVTCGW
ncbi:hypothetical protein AOLI_G00163610 [Acnodon oligacanthus]